MCIGGVNSKVITVLYVQYTIQESVCLTSHKLFDRWGKILPPTEQVLDVTRATEECPVFPPISAAICTELRTRRNVKIAVTISRIEQEDQNIAWPWRQTIFAHHNEHCKRVSAMDKSRSIVFYY
jgi:hypothetical protein